MVASQYRLEIAEHLLAQAASGERDLEILLEKLLGNAVSGPSCLEQL